MASAGCLSRARSTQTPHPDVLAYRIDTRAQLKLLRSPMHRKFASARMLLRERRMYLPDHESTSKSYDFCGRSRRRSLQTSKYALRQQPPCQCTNCNQFRAPILALTTLETQSPSPTKSGVASLVRAKRRAKSPTVRHFQLIRDQSTICSRTP